MSDYRSPQHQRALGSAGTAPATGNLPSKVTASPEAPQRAHSKTKSSECLQGLIQRPLKPKMLLILTHFLVISQWLPNSLFWSYLHIHMPINLISLNLFQVPPTELLNSACLRCSPLKKGTTQPGEVYLASFAPNHQATAPCLGKIAFPMPSSLPMATYEFAASRPWVHCFMPNGNTKPDQGQDPSTLTGCFKFLRLVAQHRPRVTTRRWDKAQIFHCLAGFTYKEKTDQTITLVLLPMGAKANAQNSILKLNFWLHANSKWNKRLPWSIWIPFQHRKHNCSRATVLLLL